MKHVTAALAALAVAGGTASAAQITDPHAPEGSQPATFETDCVSLGAPVGFNWEYPKLTGEPASLTTIINVKRGFLTKIWWIRVQDPANPVNENDLVSTPIADLYEWDLDGDGTFETQTGRDPSVTTTFTAAGVRTVTVRLTEAGRSCTYSQSVPVHPAPPKGEIGVSIDDEELFTSAPQVTVDPVWPPFAATVTLSNDGGFRNAKTFPVRASIPWTLRSSGPERLPRTGYARFNAGSGTIFDREKFNPTTFTDDIILDEVPPTVPSATLDASGSTQQALDHAARGQHAVKRRPVKPKGRAFILHLSARDNLSGINRIEVRSARNPLLTRTVKGSPTQLTRSVKVHSLTGRVQVRVRDGAGNASRWKTVRAR